MQNTSFVNTLYNLKKQKKLNKGKTPIVEELRYIRETYGLSTDTETMRLAIHRFYNITKENEEKEK